MTMKSKRNKAGAILHHLRTLLNNDRKVIISLVVAAGMLSSVVLSQFPQDFETHYYMGFTRSLVLFLFTFSVIMYTNSIRLVGLLILILCSMFLDLLILTDHEVYDPLYEFRYGDISFSTGFQVYEIICLIFIFNRDDFGRITRATRGFMGHILNVCNSANILHFSCDKSEIRKN